MRQGGSRRPRVGHIQFLNCLPLYYGLVRGSGILDLDLAKGTPTELNRMLLQGELDVSPVSSIEYARHAGELILMPDLTVSADGPAKSILLISKVPLEELDGRKVALANTSATSQILVEIILSRRYGAKPAYFESPPDLARMLFEGDAALLIGDDALRYLISPTGLLCYDLGTEWKALTGKAIVFAAWGVRREFAAREPGLVTHVYNLFKGSMQYSREHLAAIAKDAARWGPFSPDFLEQYFAGLRFEFGSEYRAGLMEYYREAQALGHLATVPDLEFVGVPAARVPDTCLEAASLDADREGSVTP